MKHVLLSILVILSASSCGLPSPIIPTETPMVPAVFTPVCISPEPAQIDIDRALSLPGSAFDAAEWKRNYTVETNRVSVSWLNDSQSTVAYDEALIFPCGYEEQDVDNYFSDENWKTIFQNYESYNAEASCKTNDGLRLYQFSAQHQGMDYAIKFWAQNDTDNRVVTFMLVFPSSSASLMDTYALRLFPKLVSCK